MLDKNYQKALKEVDEVLKYTDSNLLEKIPNKFINLKAEYYNNQKVKVKSYDEIFKNENVNNTITNKELTIIKKENIVTKFINWIKNIFTKAT